MGTLGKALGASGDDARAVFFAAGRRMVDEQGAEAILCKHWANGSAGIEELSHKVVQLAGSGAAKRSVHTRSRSAQSSAAQCAMAFSRLSMNCSV